MFFPNQARHSNNPGLKTNPQKQQKNNTGCCQVQSSSNTLRNQRVVFQLSGAYINMETCQIQEAIVDKLCLLNTGWGIRKPLRLSFALTCPPPPRHTQTPLSFLCRYLYLHPDRAGSSGLIVRSKLRSHHPPFWLKNTLKSYWCCIITLRSKKCKLIWPRHARYRIICYP